MNAFRTFVLLSCLALNMVPAIAAENLKLRDGISYVHDLDKGFPIVADKMEDVELSAEHPTMLFFGAAGDLNTNRQAKRMVDLYKKYKAANVKFVVIDVDHPLSSEAKTLIKSHYQNYIPAQILFDKSRKQRWTHSGETETSIMSAQIDKLTNN